MMYDNTMQINEFIELLQKLHLTGTLNRNTPEASSQSVRELIAMNNYWTFDAKEVEKLDLNYDRIIEILDKRLGSPVAKSGEVRPPFIDPQKTADGLFELRRRLESEAAKKSKVLFATAHPGSLFGFYEVLSRYYSSLGGELVRFTQPHAVPENRWLDDCAGVIMLSDEGNLMHTHSTYGLEEIIAQVKPDLIVSDHGFAMAGINQECPTIALFDVDDPALPLMAELHPNRVSAIPINDNQTNTRSAQAAAALLKVVLT